MIILLLVCPICPAPICTEYTRAHGLITHIHTKVKCRPQNILTCKRLCGRFLSEFIDWKHSQSCWYFRPSFENCCPSNLLSGSTLPPLPPSLVCLCQSTVYTDIVWLGGGGGCRVSNPVGDYFLQEFNTLYLNRYTTYKIARPPNKNLGGEWASCCKVPSQVNLFR
jgi:hypothetical protein